MRLWRVYLTSWLALSIKKCLLLLIAFYRLCISPYTPRSCRFYPSCSQYALDALETHGLLRGLVLITKRLAKCHPFSRAHGVDFVPHSSSCSKHHDPK